VTVNDIVEVVDVNGEHDLPLKCRLFRPRGEGDRDREEQRDLGYGAVSMRAYMRHCSPHSCVALDKSGKNETNESRVHLGRLFCYGCDWAKPSIMNGR
jgi:hypothetical protein